MFSNAIIFENISNENISNENITNSYISDNTWIMVIGMTETNYLQKIFTIANMWLA